MRIQAIEVTDYKTFLGTHTFNVGGKNLFIYGENGSGKGGVALFSDYVSDGSLLPETRSSALTVPTDSAEDPNIQMWIN